MLGLRRRHPDASLPLLRSSSSAFLRRRFFLLALRLRRGLRDVALASDALLPAPLRTAGNSGGRLPESSNRGRLEFRRWNFLRRYLPACLAGRDTSIPNP